MVTTDLRPLGLGPLLDRAITLSFRHFGTLIAASAVTYVPFAAVQWLLVGRIAVGNPGTFTGRDWALVAIDAAAAFAVFVLTRTALAAVGRAAYLARPISLRGAYRLAVRRFGAQILNLFFAGVIGSMALTFVSIPLTVVAVIATAGGGDGIVPITVAAGIAVAALTVVGAWLYVAFELATVRIAVDARQPYAAFFAALGATVFRRPWRALLAGLLLLLVTGGGALIVSALADLVPSIELRAAVWTALSAVEAMFVEVLSVGFLVAYDVDLAVRHEGLDLAAALGEPV